MNTPVANILVVDDTPANLTLLCGILSERGYRVRPAPSGALALTAAAAEAPDLILLDISMPDMDGFEVCARVKADPRLNEVPVIFLTAHTDIADKVKAFSVGGVDYVTKPFQTEEVHARVATHLQLCWQRRDLRKSYDRLAELERMRDGLVHMLVHDLRSPLSVIISYAELLRDEAEGMQPEAIQYLDECVTAAKKMIGMVTAVLDVSKLEQPTMKLQPGPCDLAAISRSVIADMRGLARGRQVVIDSSTPEVPLDADAALLTRVIQNLLANALDFTPPRGAVHIDVGVNRGTARFAIADEGPGVEDAAKERIFQKFGTVGGQSDRYSTGLGLTFCRMAVEAHGGAIGVEDKVGTAGSVFWFTLPTTQPLGVGAH